MDNNVKFLVEKFYNTTNFFGLIKNKRYELTMKSTKVDSITSSNLHHHYKHKMAALRNYCHRVINILNTNNKKKETKLTFN